LQDRLATTDTDCLQRLDSLVQTASNLLRLQQQRVTAAAARAEGGSPATAAASSRRRLHTAARNRRADSSSPTSGMRQTNIFFVYLKTQYPDFLYHDMHGCRPVFRIRIHFLRIQIRIQWIRMEANTDPDPIRIQGFNDQKLKKK
jgi:hypothetical protein